MKLKISGSVFSFKSLCNNKSLDLVIPRNLGNYCKVNQV